MTRLAYADNVAGVLPSHWHSASHGCVPAIVMLARPLPRRPQCQVLCGSWYDTMEHCMGSHAELSWMGGVHGCRTRNSAPLGIRFNDIKLGVCLCKIKMTSSYCIA